MVCPIAVVVESSGRTPVVCESRDGAGLQPSRRSVSTRHRYPPDPGLGRYRGFRPCRSQHNSPTVNHRQKKEVSPPDFRNDADCRQARGRFGVRLRLYVHHLLPPEVLRSAVGLRSGTLVLILLADDSPHAQRMGERILREEGFEVVSLTDGDAAMLRLADVDPDLILADVFLPGKSGFELCRYVKNEPRFKHVRVVLTAGLLEPFDEEEAKRAGCDAILKKPFEASKLVTTIDPLVKEAQLARGLFADEIALRALASGAAQAGRTGSAARSRNRSRTRPRRHHAGARRRSARHDPGNYRASLDSIGTLAHA